MKRIALTLVAILLVAFQLLSQSPTVEPDPAYLPALLDSVCYMDYDSETDHISPTGGRAFIYDSNGNLTEETTYRWDPDTNEWKKDTRIVKTYDSNGNHIESVNYSWDSENENWTLPKCFYCSYYFDPMRYTYKYDFSGHLVEEIRDNWIYSSNEWVWTTRIVYTYGANGKQIEEIREFFSSSSNELNEKLRIVSTYDARGNLSKDVIYWQEFGSNEWEGYDSTAYAYNANGNLTGKGHYNSISALDSSSYVYNSRGIQTHELRYSWNSYPKSWVFDESTVYMYDANENVTAITTYMMIWDHRWIERSRTLNTYDTNGHLHTRKYYWNPYNTGLILQEVSEVYWTELITQTGTSPEIQKFNIFPNPTYNVVSIETDMVGQLSIEITTLNGQQIFIGEMEGTTHQLDLSSFQKGIYFITIKSKDFVATRKIIKL